MNDSLKGILTLLLVSASCTMVEEKVAPPQDFSVSYEWKEASLPPPHHYELTVVIGPGGRGRLDFLPDYPSNATPVWTETFAVKEEELAALFARSEQIRTARDRQPDHPDTPSVGGQIEAVTVTSLGESVHVATAPSGDAADLIAAVRSLVPDLIWKKMMERRELYIAQRRP